MQRSTQEKWEMWIPAKTPLRTRLHWVIEERNHLQFKSAVKLKYVMKGGVDYKVGKAETDRCRHHSGRPGLFPDTLWRDPGPGECLRLSPDPHLPPPLPRCLQQLLEVQTGPRLPARSLWPETKTMQGFTVTVTEVYEEQSNIKIKSHVWPFISL